LKADGIAMPHTKEMEVGALIALSNKMHATGGAYQWIAFRREPTRNGMGAPM
jgi:hypothetical protein